jgi:hypothetical protein
MQFKTRGEVALYVWDYFFISNGPHEGDEKSWIAIERATCRIRESEPFLDPPSPADVRLRHARRVRNSARVALRHIELLSVAPDGWVLQRLEELEQESDKLVEKLSDEARQLVVD